MGKQSEGIKSQQNEKRVRVFQFAQYTHDLDGKPLIDEDTIKLAILSRKTIKRAAYIKHDMDVYSEEDELRQKKYIANDVYTAADEQDNPNHKAGTQKSAKYRQVVKGQPKPPHYHVVCDLGNNATQIYRIADWFKMPEYLILSVIGRDGFLDCCEYLTHESEKEQAAGKTFYPDSCVKAFHFDFRETLNEMHERQAKYGRKDISLRDRWVIDITNHGKSLRSCREEDTVLYMTNITLLEKCRREYLSMQEPPLMRTSIYVCGDGRIGKGLMCAALARGMFPGLPDDEVFFMTGGNNVTFDGYDGQPVIIWDDCRAANIMSKLGSREEVFTVFDTFPKAKRRSSVKHSYTYLSHTVNLVNSVQPYSEFLDGLAGEYKGKDGAMHKAEDKNQSYGRFPFIFPLYKDTFDLLMNKGLWFDGVSFMEYEMIQNIKGNFSKLQLLTSGEQRKEIERKMLSIPLQKIEEYKELKTDDNKELSDEMVAELTTWGTTDNERTERERIIKEQDKTIQHLRGEIVRLNGILAGIRHDPDPHRHQQHQSYLAYHRLWLANMEKQLAEFEESIRNGAYMPPPFSPPEPSFVEDELSNTLDDVEEKNLEKDDENA